MTNAMLILAVVAALITISLRLSAIIWELRTLNLHMKQLTAALEAKEAKHGSD